MRKKREKKEESKTLEENDEEFDIDFLDESD